MKMKGPRLLCCLQLNPAPLKRHTATVETEAGLLLPWVRCTVGAAGSHSSLTRGCGVWAALTSGVGRLELREARGSALEERWGRHQKDCGEQC